ncbi:MAG: hypothetical protein B6I36_06580 [Desulfobacteraceae bacterium 4572_35.1]|nr:MAG: hypothetical protein B6I36_06580 [Desulfobacteraceae bacterium 4572_35.1]
MDFIQLWDNILFWVVYHPGIAYTLVLLISLSESLAVVGLLVPGSVMMVGVGTMVGSGAISLPVTMVVATVGAVVGDGVSYWFGHHYHQQIKNFWPFCQHPQLITHGEAFIDKHGGKSVFFARFVGPMRPLVPMIAGMLDLAPRRFFIANIISAVGWSCAYITPGVVLAKMLPVFKGMDVETMILLLCIVGVLWLFVGTGRKRQ